MTTDILAQKIVKEASFKDVKTNRELLQIKRRVYKEAGLSGFPTNISLLNAYRELIKEKGIEPNEAFERLFITKKMRSLSGVSVITILTKDYPCPGQCIYCPTQKGVPKSYLNDEPAVMRAILNDYDPKKQIQTRLRSLKNQGHPIEKIELIVIGGTFSYLEREYQESYIKDCFDVLNGKSSKNLGEAQKLNETSDHKMVGLTLETRPDYINESEVEWFRYLGCTRVELGVQAVDDEILKITKRGHTVETTKKATKLLKDAGFKICYHLMPNLPGSNPDKDIEMFKEVFSNPDYKPDFIKVYPCMVMKGTELYDMWKLGEYKSYSDKDLFRILKEMKKSIPYYVRIMRLIRDIPAPNISSGSTVSNLRQVLEDSKVKDKWDCKCIRCREVKGDDFVGELKLFREDYEASGGKEIFLSYENEDRSQLYSLLRLRIPSSLCHPGPSPVIPAQAGIQWNKNQMNFNNLDSRLRGNDKNKSDNYLPELSGAALIREVHTYGQELETGKKGTVSQHRGLGRKLIEEAEKITKSEFGLKKIAVISGVGVRGYYQKFDYELKGTYMIKELTTKIFL